MPDPRLPDVHAGVLSPAELDAFARDLDACADVVSVTVRSPVRGGAAAVLATPRDAIGKLRSGAAPAAQLRYRFDGALWLDTLTTTPDGIRLVRIRHDDVPTTETRP